MPYISTSDGTEIYYKDWGPKTAQPIVFHHGWPLSADDWDNQLMFFLGQGFRVIAHDRRGHGRSTQTDVGNEMSATISIEEKSKPPPPPPPPILPPRSAISFSVPPISPRVE